MSNIIQFPTPTVEQTKMNDRDKVLDKIFEIRDEMRMCATREDAKRLAAKLRRWEKKLENF